MQELRSPHFATGRQPADGVAEARHGAEHLRHRPRSRCPTGVSWHDAVTPPGADPT